jgi:predicted nucleic-acid-binding protein
MIALDTNLLVRVITNDNKRQVAASLRVLQQHNQVLLLNTVLLETVWVLQAVYDASREDVVNALNRLLAIAIPETPMVVQAVQWFSEGMDFADVLHLATASEAHCDTLYSFDKPFAKVAVGKTDCVVTRPV